MNQGYKNIGANIRLIRKSLHLSLKSFAELTGVSKTTIVNIENNIGGLKLDTLNKLISFSSFSIDELEKSNFSIPKNFKATLLKKYKDTPEIAHFFVTKPSIKNALDYALENSAFFNEPREIFEIVQFFSNMNWSYKGTSIQNELKKHPKITYQNHSFKKATFVYYKKQ